MKEIRSRLGIFGWRMRGLVLRLWPLAFIGAACLPASGQMFTRVTNELRFAQTDAGAIVWFDYDNDGWADLLFGGGWKGGYGNRLFHNNHDGSFTQVGETNFAGMGAHGFWATAADFNDDGFLDIIAPNSLTGTSQVDEAPFLYLGQGNGRFTKLVLGRSSILGAMDVRASTVTALDYNGDGFLDLGLGRYDVPTKSCLLKNTGGGLFSAITNTAWTLQSQSYESASSVDYDGDGAPDLLGMGVSRPLLFRNSGAGDFVRVTNSLLYTFQAGFATLSAAWGDYDNDGNLDVAITYVNEAPKKLQVFLNDGSGNFRLGFAVTVQSQYASCLDYDNDGKLDLYVTGFSSRSRLYRNLGGGSFTEVLNEPPVQDVFAQFPVAGWGDYNNDGFMDLLVAASGSVNGLYVNSTNGNHWLKVKLNGQVSNRAAIGAVVRVRAIVGGQEVWQMRVVQAQSSFTEIVPHFGLGDATNVDLVRIEWPSGNVQELANYAVDRVLTLTEPNRISPLRPTASLGASITLTSQPTGISYQWLLNGTDLVGQTNRTLTLTNLTVADAGRYTVVVAPTIGPAQTNFTYLTVDTQFTKVTSGPHVTDLGNSYTSSWGDYDNDGDADLFVTRYRLGTSQLYRNNGDGTFIAAASPFPATDGWGTAIVADFDNDGWPDLFAGRETAPSMFQYNQTGQSFTASNSIPLGTVWNASAADFDRDGLLDLYFTLPNRLLRNQGGRVFQPMTLAQTGDLLRYSTAGGACWGDFDDDGWTDVYAPDHGGNRNYLFRNQGSRFTQVTNTLTQTTMAALAGAWGDYDNDGRLDLAIACIGGNSVVCRNLGGGQFAVAAIGVTISGQYDSASWADYDNDGFLDLFMTCGGSGANSLFRNNGNGTFTRITTGSVVTEKPIDDAASYNGLWFDANGDGFLDLYVSNGNDTATPGTANFFYLNNTNGNHWLQVRLIGTTSNPQGIGAKVRAAASIAGKIQWQRRDITAGDAYNGNNLYAHFGLGDATKVIALKIEWPSGIVQELSNVAVNQVLPIIEPLRPVLNISISHEGVLNGSLRADPNRMYQILVSEDLLNWTPLGGVTNDAQGLGAWTDPGAAGSSQRFYKASLAGP